MTWFETIAGNQRTWSRALGDVVRDVARRADDALERRRVAAGLLGRLPCGVHDPLDDHRVGELDDHAVADATRDGERLRPVARDPHRDLGQLRPHPLELELLVVPVHLAAVHEVLDHPAAPLELGHLDGLLADVAPRRVAAPDAHHHPAVRDVVQRRVAAREHRRLARARVRHAVAELHRRRRLRGQREQRERLLPEDVRVVRPAVLEAVRLGELEELDEAARGGSGRTVTPKLRAMFVSFARSRGRLSRSGARRSSVNDLRRPRDPVDRLRGEAVERGDGELEMLLLVSSSFVCERPRRLWTKSITVGTPARATSAASWSGPEGSRCAVPATSGSPPRRRPTSVSSKRIGSIDQILSHSTSIRLLAREALARRLRLCEHRGERRASRSRWSSSCSAVSTTEVTIPGLQTTFPEVHTAPPPVRLVRSRGSRARASLRRRARPCARPSASTPRAPPGRAT